MSDTVSTPAGDVRKGTLLQARLFLGNLVTGSVLAIEPHGRNGQTTLTLECGDAGHWCYPDQVERVIEF